MEPGDMAIQNNRHLQGQGSTLPIESGKADFISIGRSSPPHETPLFYCTPINQHLSGKDN